MIKNSPRISPRSVISILGLPAPPQVFLQTSFLWAQDRAGTSKPEWGKWYEKPPYVDAPTDQRNIREGIDYAIQNGY